VLRPSGPALADYCVFAFRGITIAGSLVLVVFIIRLCFGWFGLFVDLLVGLGLALLWFWLGVKLIFNWAEADRFTSGVLTFEDFVNASERHVERSIKDRSELDNIVVRAFRDRAFSDQEWQTFHHDILRRLSACSTRRGQFLALRQETVTLIEVATRAGCVLVDEYTEEEKRQLVSLMAPNVSYEKYFVSCLKNRVFAQMSCRCLRTLAFWYGDNRMNDWFDMYCDAFRAFFDAQCTAVLCYETVMSDIAAAPVPLLSAKIEEMKEKIVQGYNCNYDREAAEKECNDEVAVSEPRAQPASGLRV
jgi:hypothetical protein